MSKPLNASGLALVSTIVLFNILDLLSDSGGVLSAGGSNFLGWTLPMIFVFDLGIIITLTLLTAGIYAHSRKASVGTWGRAFLIVSAAVVATFSLLFLTWVVYGIAMVFGVDV